MIKINQFHASHGVYVPLIPPPDMTEEIDPNAPLSSANNTGLGNAQGANGPVGTPGGTGGGGGVSLLNGANGNGNGAATPATGGQQPLHPTTPPPSSWASKVRAGLGSDNSPTLTGASGGGIGVGSVGDLTPGEMDTGTGVGIGEGMQGLPRSMGHLGSLATGGNMGPVHGLDMEGGMPGRAMPQSSSGPDAGGNKGAVGAVGMVVGGARGHHDNLHQGQQQGSLHRGPEILGNGARRGSGVGAGMPGIDGDGSAALAQEFSALEIGASLASAVSGRGSDGQGFDAAKDELLGDFPCVRLRGLSADTSVKDILDFFVGLGPVLDIVLEVRAGRDCCTRVTRDVSHTVKEMTCPNLIIAHSAIIVHE